MNLPCETMKCQKGECPLTGMSIRERTAGIAVANLVIARKDPEILRRDHGREVWEHEMAVEQAERFSTEPEAPFMERPDTIARVTTAIRKQLLGTCQVEQ